jgi:predicted transcriptional regulator
MPFCHLPATKRKMEYKETFSGTSIEKLLGTLLSEAERPRKGLRSMSEAQRASLRMRAKQAIERVRILSKRVKEMVSLGIAMYSIDCKKVLLV